MWLRATSKEAVLIPLVWYLWSWPRIIGGGVLHWHMLVDSPNSARVYITLPTAFLTRGVPVPRAVVCTIDAPQVISPSYRLKRNNDMRTKCNVRG
jgi:hypothetical protein